MRAWSQQYFYKSVQCIVLAGHDIELVTSSPSEGMKLQKMDKEDKSRYETDEWVGEQCFLRINHLTRNFTKRKALIIAKALGYGERRVLRCLVAGSDLMFDRGMMPKVLRISIA